MSTDGYITLTREITAIKIPEGTERVLPAGTLVTITQELGGTFTVMAPDFGGLFRIQNRDADALGREVVEHAAADGAFEINRVWEQLKQVYDPEIPVNIVDLGLIYDCHLTPAGDNNYKADVKMTLTAPGCGMGPMLAQDVQNKLLNIEPIDEANVELVWDPPWNQGMMTEAAKLQLGLM